MARHVEQRVRRSEKQWTEILRRFESSGLGPHVFCRRERLATSSFQRWRQRLRSNRADFVELVPPVLATDSAPETPNGWSLEVSLPNGVSIRWRG